MAAAGVQVSVKPKASEVKDQDIPLLLKMFEEAEININKILQINIV